MERDIKIKISPLRQFFEQSINPINIDDNIKIPGQESTSITLVKIALKALSVEFDTFINECVNDDGSIKQPSKQAVMRARGCLPPYCKHAFKKKDKK